MEDDGQFGSWAAMPLSVITGFTYRPGFLYDPDVHTSCSRVGPGEFFPRLRSLKQVNSEVASRDVITPVGTIVDPYC
ncbi:hypothetical protein HNQ07_003600 [Deinococcus metalli]|uniref:Uncharacterized protein n=1 Tax=Deinococcus metalli TaxID=1141878 RepID=A0A7W8KH45_9DEIO|nr:hypothetical protein [Deinococcus metalli]